MLSSVCGKHTIRSLNRPLCGLRQSPNPAPYFWAAQLPVIVKAENARNLPPQAPLQLDQVNPILANETQRETCWRLLGFSSSGTCDEGEKVFLLPDIAISTRNAWNCGRHLVSMRKQA